MRRLAIFLFLATLPAAPKSLADNAFGILGRAVSPAKLRQYIEARRTKFPALQKIAEILGNHGVRGWMWGGTAAGFLHDSRWHLLAEAQPDAFVPGRLADELDVTFRSTQDFDLAIQGTCDDAELLEAALGQAMPGLKFEVRALSYRCGEKDALLSRDVLLQHGDSGSTGTIELTATPPGESVLRDLKTFYAPKADQPGAFLADGAAARIRYLPSPSHLSTRRAREGNNPEILSVVRILVKAQQYGLTIDAADWRWLKAAVQRFDPATLGEGYARNWLRRQGRKIIMHSLDMAEALRWTDELDLRWRLLALGNGPKRDSHFDAPDEDASFWLSRKPLPRLGVPRPVLGGVATAKSLGLSIVTHGTDSIRQLEAITWNPTGRVNFFVTDYALPHSVFTRDGSQGLGLFPVTMRLHPDAVEGRDFLHDEDVTRLLNADAVTLVERPPLSLPEISLGLFAPGGKAAMAHYLPRLTVALGSRTFPWQSSEWEREIARTESTTLAAEEFTPVLARAVYLAALRRRQKEGGVAAAMILNRFLNVHPSCSLEETMREAVVSDPPGFSDDEQIAILDEAFSTGNWRRALRTEALSVQMEMLSELMSLQIRLRSLNSVRVGEFLEARYRQFLSIATRNLARRLAGKTVEESLRQLEAAWKGLPQGEYVLKARIWTDTAAVVRANAERQFGSTVFVRRTFAAMERRRDRNALAPPQAVVVALLRSLIDPARHSSAARISALRAATDAKLRDASATLAWVSALEALAASPSWHREFGMDRVKKFFRRYFRHELYLDYDTLEDFIAPRKEFQRLDVFSLWKERRKDMCGALLGR